MSVHNAIFSFHDVPARTMRPGPEIPTLESIVVSVRTAPSRSVTEEKVVPRSPSFNCPPNVTPPATDGLSAPEMSAGSPLAGPFTIHGPEPQRLRVAPSAADSRTSSEKPSTFNVPETAPTESVAEPFPESFAAESPLPTVTSPSENGPFPLNERVLFLLNKRVPPSETPPSKNAVPPLAEKANVAAGDPLTFPSKCRLCCPPKT